MLSPMLFAGDMDLIIASADRIHASYPPITKISLL